MGCGGGGSVRREMCSQGGFAVSEQKRARRTALVAYGKTVWSWHPLLMSSCRWRSRSNRIVSASSRQDSFKRRADHAARMQARGFLRCGFLRRLACESAVSLLSRWRLRIMDRRSSVAKRGSGDKLSKLLALIVAAYSPIARQAAEANCRRQVTITTAAVVTNKTQGLTNQPR